VYVRRVYPSTFTFSLSSHRHSLLLSHFITNKNKTRKQNDFLLFLELSCVETLLDLCHFHHTGLYCHLKSKVVNIFTKVTVSSINLNIDGVPISSRSHAHPSHSQISLLLSSSLLMNDRSKCNVKTKMTKESC
jgi:hypothetical protein